MMFPNEGDAVAMEEFQRVTTERVKLTVAQAISTTQLRNLRMDVDVMLDRAAEALVIRMETHVLAIPDRDPIQWQEPTTPRDHVLHGVRRLLYAESAGLHCCGLRARWNRAVSRRPWLSWLGLGRLCSWADRKAGAVLAAILRRIPQPHITSHKEKRFRSVCQHLATDPAGRHFEFLCDTRSRGW